MILVIQIALFALAIAHEPCKDNNLPGWWLHLPPGPTAYNPCQFVSTTCLLKSQPVVRRDDYTYTPGIGGHKVHTRASTWHEARRICEEEGGHLAIINSIAEANAINNIYKNAGSTQGSNGYVDFAFIGFHDLFQEGEYLTIHSQSLAKAGYTQWSHPFQPDNAGGAENCGSVHKNGGLNDLGCNGKYAFICELPIC